MKENIQMENVKVGMYALALLLIRCTVDTRAATQNFDSTLVS